MDDGGIGGGSSRAGTLDWESALAARRELEEHKEQKRAALRERIKRERRVLLPVLGCAVLAWPNFGIAKVVGHSMEPTYHTGDTLVVLKTFRYLSPLRPGDIIVIQMNHGKIKGEDIVKRVVFVQNHEGNAPFPKTLPVRGGRRTMDTRDLFPDLVTGTNSVPRDQILFMGDNLPVSMDSREVGSIAANEVLGKVILP